jgi:ufm1-conjugating enzyme 1
MADKLPLLTVRKTKSAQGQRKNTRTRPRSPRPHFSTPCARAPALSLSLSLRSQVNAGPRDPAWPARLKEELAALIAFISATKAAGGGGGDCWFSVTPADPGGLAWSGVAWATHDCARYRFPFAFDTPAAYPAAPPALRIPALEGKTPKMYRGGAICLDAHFAPLWARHAPGFGFLHSLVHGLGPWLAAEVPALVAAGAIQPAAEGEG